MPDAKSWRQRRWDLFMAAYNTSPVFREKLQTFKNVTSNTPEYSAYFSLLLDNGMPPSLMGAILVYLTDPYLPEKIYHKQIMSPVLFWNKYSSTLQPEGTSISLNWLLKMQLFHVMKKYNIPEDKAEAFTQDIIENIALETTVIQVQPYIGKSELRDILLEYGDQFSELSSTRSKIRDQLNNPALLTKVYKPLDSNIIDRDNLVLKWRMQSPPIPYKKITIKLEELGYLPQDEASMKQMIYRLKKQKIKLN